MMAFEPEWNERLIVLDGAKASPMEACLTFRRSPEIRSLWKPLSRPRYQRPEGCG